VSRIPDEVRRLAEERARRRAAREFAAADRLRERIAEAGFRVVDRPGGGSDLSLKHISEPTRQEAIS
jgi:cysteinyl-tRNA synthetase